MINIRQGANKYFIQKCVLHTFARRLTDRKLQNYQHFVAGDIPTLHFQSSLPRLPIPDLKQTCEKYLAAVKPLVDERDYFRTKEIVNDFLLLEGPKLQRMLMELDESNSHTSYISKPWIDRILTARNPLCIDRNYVIIMKQDNRNEFNNQLIKTCNVVISTLRLMRTIQNHSFQPTIQYLFDSKWKQKLVGKILRWTPAFMATKVAYILKAIPKDMVQFLRLFGRSRIPENKRDLTVQYHDTKHIIVLKNGLIYYVKVLNEIGNIEPPEVIFETISHIYQSRPPATSCSVASLTTLDREHWANLREHLSKNLENKIQLEEIDSALFCVSIEDSNPYLNSSDNEMSKLKLMLAGNGKNRWFDKTLTAIIDIDGTVGLSFEHSCSDGRLAVRVCEEIYNDTTTLPFIAPTFTTTSLSSKTDETELENGLVREIKFRVDDTIESGIKHAIKNHSLKMDSLQINNFRFTKLNRIVCKTFKLSPDSIAQLGFQLACYKQHLKFLPTYEPCNTQKFLHGRTDAIRPCTEGTQELCYAICRKSESHSRLMTLIHNYSELHSRKIQQSTNGQGFDRHLYCLRYLARESRLEEPNLFSDISYQTLIRDTIIPTTVSSKTCEKSAFGPLSPDGLAIWYRIESEAIEITMSYYPDCVKGLEFLDLLQESYNEIVNILHKSTSQ